MLMGNGDGTFHGPARRSRSGKAPISITEGDFENNGRIDLAVADIVSGDVTILSNQGGGNFLALPPIELPGGHADIHRGGRLRHRQPRPGRDRLELQRG